MKRLVTLVLILLLAVSAVGCASNKLNSSGNENQKLPDGKPASSDQADNNGENASGAIDVLIGANREFSWDIFKKLNAEDSDKEVFISPLSISGMLMMALNGAEGPTRDAIAKALRYEGISPEDLNSAYANLFKRISNLDKKVDIRIANSIWTRDGFEVNKDFIDINRSYLTAETRNLDFSDPKSADVINKWISQKTNNLIDKMIDPPIPADVVMYLVNAIYFKGEWTDAFKAKDTQSSDFYALDGKTDKVSMMYRKGTVDNLKNDEIQAVRLPYGKGGFSMVIAMPDKDINQWIAGMNRDKWGTLLESFSPVSDLELRIPKFRMEYGTKELKQSLSDLGMGIAFSDSADFSGIADNLYISKVLHKAVIEVNEEGTKAAAATTGEMTLTAIREPVTFTADHPFVFAIVDNADGNILFIGKKASGDR